MRIIFTFLVTVYISLSTYGQSVSASKIITFLESQDNTEISQKLKDLDFTYIGKVKFIGKFKAHQFYTISDYGKELVSISQNDELYMIVYELADLNFFNSLKEKMLTSEFVYAYSYKDTKYYESTNMRIGVNAKKGILSFFVVLK